MSAWLPPGLALGWLAVLATFVRGAGALLAAWAATVSLAVLLAQRRTGTSPGDPSEADRDPEAPERASGSGDAPTSPRVSPHTPAGGVGALRDGATDSADTTEKAVRPAPHDPDPEPAPGSPGTPVPVGSPPPAVLGAAVPGLSAPTGQLATGEIVATLGLRVLTADEVAAVLRVDAKVIVTAISSGELPGNRVGTHWRVDQGALTRWLQGRYGTAAGSTGSASPTELRTDPR
jgi:excisionase family DNA binding protein